MVERGKYKTAHLTLTSFSDAATYAIVTTTGGGTYELEVSGGFYTGNADDQSLDYNSVRGYVEFYVLAGMAYLAGKWTIRKSRVFRVPILTIQDKSVTLNLAPLGHGSSNPPPPV